MKFYYFGCHDRPGHFMHGPHFVYSREASDFLELNPWKYGVDGRLQPSGEQVEGRALIHHKDGWTALAFWDRSVDTRGGCCSVFLGQGDFGFDQMMEFAREYFPEVLNRLKFPIVLLEEPK